MNNVMPFLASNEQIAIVPDTAIVPVVGIVPKPKPSKNWNLFDGKEARLNLYSALKKPTPRPNREGLQIIKGQETKPLTTYPRICKTDEQKFLHLSRLFITDTIEKPMFVEFADVLKFQHPQWIEKEQEKIDEVLSRKMMMILTETWGRVPADGGK